MSNYIEEEDPKFQEGVEKFDKELQSLLNRSEKALTPEEHLALVRELQKLFENNHSVAWQLGVDTSASYRDNEAYLILENAEAGGINTVSAVNYYNWLPSSWDRC